MFNGRHFYNKSIRNYVVLMGTLFNQISVLRTNQTDPMIVPIQYQSKEKFIAYLTNMNSQGQDPRVPELQTILPRMSFYLRELIYNPKIKTNALQYSINVVDENGQRVTNKQFAPVPYIFRFEVSIYTRYEDDMLQIIEQILPYFQPHFNAKIREEYVSGMVDRDIYINLEKCVPNEEQIGLMNDDRRMVIWDLEFDLYGWLYPQVQEARVIKKTVVNFVGDIADILDENAAIFRATDEVIPGTANINDPHTIKSTREYLNEG